MQETEGKQVVERFLEQGILEQSEEPLLAMQPWQRYDVFPSRYLETVHWSITGKCNFKK